MTYEALKLMQYEMRCVDRLERYIDIGVAVELNITL